MKLFKRLFILLAFVLIIALSTNNVINAHSNQLDITYDYCVPKDYKDENDIGDGYEERWYQLVNKKNCTYHIPNATEGITTIKYYINPTSEDEYITWNIIASAKYAIEDYKTSMEKWNNIYFFNYVNDGSIIKRKMINIVEGTKEDHNLIIYLSDGEGKDWITTTYYF